ncbi:hypothetical protein ANCCAN_28247 [Ancylostoma caninum]|uniref:Uncharacterized protein n=1 Tax=Ancylostoma caninum TaxID=29170 RepID=A0A368F1S2_ANCCA|nr:hypothetical protein ANCCAN_28247 [Ancylostoma caninum]
MSSSNVAATLRSILTTDNNLSSELSTALISLGSVIDQIQTKQQEAVKELELVRRMSRTNWLMVINMPLPFGVSKGQALQQLFSKLGYMKPLFDSERDLLATDILFVNRSGQHCNMSFFVAQRHYDHLMSATFQKKILDYNQNLPKDQKLALGRVLTPNERADYEMACALKRLIISKMHDAKKADPSYQVLFVLVDKKTLRLRIDKQYLTLEEASLRYGIGAEELVAEKKRYADSVKPTLNKKGRAKRPGSSDMGPDSKNPRL